MKPSLAFRSFLLGSSLLAAPSLHAARIYWDSNGLTSGLADGAGVWLTANQWWDGSSNVNWSSYTAPDAVFGWGGAGGTVTLASPTTVGSLTFKYFTGTYTLGTTAQAITLNNGITKIGGAVGAVNIISPLTLAGAQTWTNQTFASAGAINVQAATTLNGNLTFDGDGIFNFTATAAVIGGTGNLIKNGTGQLNLSAAGTPPTHTFTGDIVVNGGSIGFQNSGVLTGRNVHLTDGYLGGRSTSGFTWTGGLGTGANQIRITGGTSGLSGEGTASSAFQIGSTPGSTLIWGASGEGSATGFFNPTVLLLNGDHRMNAGGKGSLNNAIDLNGTTRTITSTHVTDGVNTSGFTVLGAITTSSGTAGLNKTGTGNLILTADNTYNGATTINGGSTLTGTSVPIINASGSITLSGAGGRLSGTNALNLSSGGILRMVSTNAENAVDRMNTAAITVNGGGGLWWENVAGANSFAETVGNVIVNSGLFNVNLTTNQTAAGSQTLTLGTLTRNGASSLAFSSGVTGPQASGNKNMIVVTGAGTTGAGEIVGSWATTGTAVNAQTDYAVYNSNYVTAAGIAASQQTSWSTTTSATSNFTMSALDSGTLSATRNVNSFRSTNDSVTVTASNANIALASHTLAVGDVVTFAATTMPTGLTAGTPYYVVSTGAGTIQVSATSGGGAITPTTAGTAVIASGALQVSTGNNLGTTGILNGSAATLNILASGTGSITLPSAGAGQLHFTTGSGAIVNNAPVVNNGGALTLVKNGSAGTTTNNTANLSTTGTLVLNGVNTYTGDTIINGGTLRVGTNNITNGAVLGSGNYAGNIAINGGGLLYISSNANQILSGVISGDGALMKTYTGTLTLSGNNTYTGRTSITGATTSGAGILEVSSFNSVVGGTASSSLGAPTTVANGTIDLGGPTNIQGPAVLRYVGSGETTDRVVNVHLGGATSRTIDASGAGLLKFTSAFTSVGGTFGGATVQLIGNGSGEITQGLPFAFPNLTKSGTGTWTLGGAVESSGVLTISANGGTLALQKKSSLMGGVETYWTAPKVIVNSGGTLALNVGGTDQFDNTDVTTVLTNLGGLGGAISSNGLLSGSRIGFDTTNAAGGTFTIADNITNPTGTGSGAIGLTKRGTGTLVLSGTNAYTGATTVSAGVLAVNGSLANTSTTVANTATLQGSGSIGGSVTIQNGGTLASGNSIESLATGALGLNAGSTFAYEMNKDAAAAVAGDLTAVTGNLTLDLANAAILTLSELGAGSWTVGDKLTLISYSGTWNGGLFNYGGTLADDSTFAFSGMNWLFNYNDTVAGTNYTADLTGSNFVTMTAIPEPRAALLGALGLLFLLRRRR